MDTNVLSTLVMRNTNGSTRFRALAREVFSWGAAIRWIALDDPGPQPQWEWRDPDTRLAATATAREQPSTVDPLLSMLAESRHDIYSGGSSTEPYDLRSAVLTYRDRRKSSQDSDGTVTSTSVSVWPAMRISWGLGWPDCSIAA